MRKHSDGRQELANEPTAVSFAVLGVVFAAVVCCGLPAVMAAVGIGALAGVLGRVIGLGWPLPLVIAALIAALAYTISRTVKAKRACQRSETGR